MESNSLAVEMSSLRSVIKVIVCSIETSSVEVWASTVRALINGRKEVSVFPSV